MNYKPIGYVKRGEGCSLDEPVEIVIFNEYKDGLIGLNEFSHAIIIYHLHLAIFSGLIKTRHGVKVGVFATRSPNRPNPIGISVVKILGINDNKLHVVGINAYNETPVLDIKPYDQLDSIPNPKVPQWHLVNNRPCL